MIAPRMLPERDHPKPSRRSCLRCAIAFAALMLILVMNAASYAAAVTVDALDPSRVSRVDAIQFSGNQDFSDSDLEAAMAIKTRPFYAIWQKRPEFDPETFTIDLNQLKLFYEAHGYYDAHISYDLAVKDNQVTPHIKIAEGQPVKIDSVSVE